MVRNAQAAFSRNGRNPADLGCRQMCEPARGASALLAAALLADPAHVSRFLKRTVPDSRLLSSFLSPWRVVHGFPCWTRPRDGGLPPDASAPVLRPTLDAGFQPAALHLLPFPPPLQKSSRLISLSLRSLW